jgi:hypothetical protein
VEGPGIELVRDKYLWEHRPGRVVLPICIRAVHLEHRHRCVGVLSDQQFGDLVPSGHIIGYALWRDRNARLQQPRVRGHVSKHERRYSRRGRGMRRVLAHYLNNRLAGIRRSVGILGRRAGVVGYVVHGVLRLAQLDRLHTRPRVGGVRLHIPGFDSLGSADSEQRDGLRSQYRHLHAHRRRWLGR